MNKYDGRKPEPPYVTDIEQAVLDERERCASIAETLEWRMPVEDWQNLTKQQISVKLARDIANAIRNP
jgi:hypothetical protein